jgi:hypothetical protein
MEQYFCDIQFGFYVRRVPTEFAPYHCHSLEQNGSRNGCKIMCLVNYRVYRGSVINDSNPGIFFSRKRTKAKKVSNLYSRKQLRPCYARRRKERSIEIETVAFGRRRFVTPCNLQIPCNNYEE